jgi:hypothetical protein
LEISIPLRPNAQTRKSIFGYAFQIGSVAVSWSKSLSIELISSTEVEYKAVLNVTCEGFWIGRILADIGIVQERPTLLFYDNQGAIQLEKNVVFYSRSKY